MDNPIVIYWIVGVIVAIISSFGCYLLLPLAIRSLAEADVFFTLGNEGQGKAILRFGEFSRFTMSYEGHGFDQEWNVRLLADDGKIGKFWEDDKQVDRIIEIRKEEPPPRLASLIIGRNQKKLGGIRWLGPPFVRTVHKYNFRWTTLRQKGDKEGKLTEKIVDYDERIGHIILQDYVYYTEVTEAEDKNLVPLTASILLTVRVTNPYKALFRVEDWLGTVLGKVKPTVREWISGKTYEEITRKSESLKREDAQVILNESGFADYIESRYGVRIKALGIVKVNPDGKRGTSYVEASTRKYEAEQKRKEIEILAEAERDRISTVADGTAKEIEKVGGAKAKATTAIANALKNNPEAARVLAIGAVEAAGNKAGNWVMIPPNFISEVAGPKASDGIPPETIKLLAELIAKEIRK